MRYLTALPLVTLQLASVVVCWLSDTEFVVYEKEKFMPVLQPIGKLYPTPVYFQCKLFISLRF